jgi:hypothetical protein
MKIYFTHARAGIDTTYLTIENTQYQLKSILPLCNNAAMYDDGTLMHFYIDINKTIQGAGYTGVAATTFTVLSNDGLEFMDNFQTVTVSSFRKGITYLIPLSAPAAINMIPKVDGVSVGTLDSYIETGAGVNIILSRYNASHYIFDCSEDITILGSTTIANVVTCIKNGAIAQQVQERKALGRLTELAAFTAEVGGKC